MVQSVGPISSGIPYLVQQLHVGRRQREEVRPQRLEPDVQRDAEEQDGREDGQQAELAEPLRALGGRAVRGPPHLVHPLQLVHDAWFVM